MAAEEVTDEGDEAGMEGVAAFLNAKLDTSLSTKMDPSEADFTVDSYLSSLWD